MLVTRDKDLAQLVRDGDHYWDYAGERRFAYQDIEAKFGVRPERMADYLALMGDSVDNIPGVPGIGPKTAAALLRRSPRSRRSTRDSTAWARCRSAARRSSRPSSLQHREAAYLARRLTVIACDMPLECSLETLRRRKPDLAALGAFYDRHKFGPALRRQAERLARALKGTLTFSEMS